MSDVAWATAGGAVIVATSIILGVRMVVGAIGKKPASAPWAGEPGRRRMIDAPQRVK